MIAADALAFLDLMYSTSHGGCITLTAMQPAARNGYPRSRHSAVADRVQLLANLEALHQANQQGWGAFANIGLRRLGLSRFQRGGTADIIGLPALFVDIDHPQQEVFDKLTQLETPPSCIVHSGHGWHGYWLLRQPTQELDRANRIMHGLSNRLSGDRLHVSTAMRLPGTLNNKPGRLSAPCRIVTLNDHTFTMDDLQCWEQAETQPLDAMRPYAGGGFNPELMQVIIGGLLVNYAGRWLKNGWIVSRCIYSHRRDWPDEQPHFFFNPRIGLGNCFGKHGPHILLYQIASAMGVRIRDYGGLFAAQH